MKQLNRFDRYAVYYLVFTSPLTIIFMIWATLMNYGDKDLTGFVWDVWGWIFILWVLSLIYVVTKMLFSRRTRDIIMAKLAGIKERDEREVVIAGNAAKFSFLSTFALLLFMLLFSVSTLSIKTKAEPKHGSVAIGFGMSAIDENAIVHGKLEDGRETFDYKSLPITKPVMILIMMAWLVGSYHLVAKKELRE